MSSTLKIRDLGKNYFNKDQFTNAIKDFETSDIELLVDWYSMYDESLFKDQIKALQAELAFRKTSLGKELV